jgi:hypothetical protein
MKVIKFLFVTLLVELLPLSAMSQTHLISAIDQFLNGRNKDKIHTEKIFNNIFSIENPVCEVSIYYFNIKKSQDKDLDTIRNAFYQDKSCANRMMVKLAGSNSDVKMLLYTGYIEGYIFSLGNDTNTNYMAMEVKDSTKLSIDNLPASKKRSFALTWKEKNDSIDGKIFKISSCYFDPTILSRDSLNRLLSKLPTTEKIDSDIAKDNTDKNAWLEIAKNKKIIDYSSKHQSMSQKNIDMVRQQSQDYNKYNEIIKRLSTKQGNELVLKDVSTTDRAFLKEFSPLNDSFLSYYFLSSSEVARNEVWTEIAKKTLSLCKQYSKKIGNYAKETTFFRLIEMKADAEEKKQDNVAKMIEEAKKYLNK